MRTKESQRRYFAQWYAKNKESISLKRALIRKSFVSKKKVWNGIPYCSHCKSTENLFINAKGKNRLFYMCRKCNTERLRKYRLSDKGKTRVYEAIYRSIDKYRLRQNARQIIAYGVRKGLIKKPSLCGCGNKPVEAHHPDYNKPLEIIWLCRSCHANLHRNKSLSVV